MRFELIEHFLTPDDTPIGTSSQKPEFSQFLGQFNEYGSQHFDISPKSHPLFFYQMFIASITFLQPNILNQKLLTKSILYKNDIENRVLKLAYKRNEINGGKLVLRLLDFSSDENSEYHFTNDEINELLINLDIARDKKSINYKKIAIDHSEENFLKEISVEENLNDYVRDFNHVLELPHVSTFSEFGGCKNEIHVPYPIMFSFLSSPDNAKVLKAAVDIFDELKNAYKTLPSQLKVAKLTVQEQAGFLAGILVLNLKSRNIFQLHSITTKDSIQLHLISEDMITQRVVSKIPVVLDVRSSENTEEILKAKDLISDLGVQPHPDLEADPETSICILSTLFDGPNTVEHAFIVQNHRSYNGIVRKIGDYFDGCPEDQCLTVEELFDLSHELTLEMEYAMNILNSRSKIMMDRFVMGQVMSFDMPEMNRYKFEHIDESLNDVTTYTLYIDNDQKQIVINVMQENDLKFGEMSTFQGRIVPHYNQRTSYESLVINLIIDGKKYKTRANALYHKVDLKRWYELFHQVPDRGLSMNKFLSENRVTFDGFLKTILTFNFNEVLYNPANILEENTRYIQGIMSLLHTHYKNYLRNEQEFVAFCKGAAVEKFHLIHSFKTSDDIFALKRASKRWYSYTRQRFYYDRHETVIIIKVAQVDMNNLDLTTNSLLNKIKEFHVAVRSDIMRSTTTEKPLTFTMVFDENKIVVQLSKPKLPSRSVAITEKLGSMCLSSKPRRKKRGGMRQHCLFDWEDVDKFNDGKSGDSHNIKINEEKFLANLAEVRSDTKRAQLLDFVQQQGTIQSPKLREIVGQSRILKRLSGLSKPSHFLMRSIMLKSVVRDFLSGDYESCAANIGFIGGSYLMMKLSDSIKNRALKLSLANKAIFRSAVKVAAPFISRLTSAYNVYHLYKSIKDYKNGSSEALVSLANDGTFVLLDTVEIGAELLETFGIIEGLTSVVFPIGTALAALAMLGTEIYVAHRSFRALKQIDQEIHLTKSEWFVEGFRSILGMGVHEYIPKLVQAKELNQHLTNTKSMLLTKPGIDFVFFPTEQVCIGGRSCNNTLIVLDSKSVTHWSRTKPNTNGDFDLSCFTENYINAKVYQKQLMTVLRNAPHLASLFRSNVPRDSSYTTQRSYFCHNAIGLSKKSSSSGAAYIETGDGTDFIVGMKYNSNIVIMGDGKKYITTGNASDSFIAAENTRGVINGSGGEDFLDLQRLSPLSEKILMSISEQGTNVLNIDKKESLIAAFGIFNIIMRHSMSDLLVCLACQTRYIESGHIKDGDHYDRLMIGSANGTCNYNMQIVLNGNTKLNNRASVGTFFYRIKDSNAEMILRSSMKEKSRHIIMLDFDLSNVESIQKEKRKILLKTYGGLSLSLKFSVKRLSLVFADKVELKFKSPKLYAKVTTPTVSNAMKYIHDAERLKIIFAIWLSDKNETLLIGHSIERPTTNSTNATHHTANVMRNNPKFNSHLIGGNGEHVYVVDFPLAGNGEDFHFHNITIYFYKDEEYQSLIDTIDIHDLTLKIENKFNILTDIRVSKEDGDVIITFTGSRRNNDNTTILFSVILKSAFILQWYKKAIVIHRRPMNIVTCADCNPELNKHDHYAIDYQKVDSDELIFKPVQVAFGSNISLIIIRENDVERNMNIEIEQSIMNVDFVKHGGNLLIFAHKASYNLDSATVIVLKKFFANYFSILHTLNFEFENLKFNVMDSIAQEGFITLDRLINSERKIMLSMINN